MPKNEELVYAISVSMANRHDGFVTVISEELPTGVFELVEPNLFTKVHNGKFELGHRSGIKPGENEKVVQYNQQGFFAKVACTPDSLNDTVNTALNFAEDLMNYGVKDDKVLETQNYKVQRKALDNLTLVYSADIPPLKDDLRFKNKVNVSDLLNDSINLKNNMEYVSLVNNTQLIPEGYTYETDEKGSKNVVKEPEKDSKPEDDDDISWEDYRELRNKSHK